METSVYVKTDKKGNPLLWGFLSDTLPPGVNQMYATGSIGPKTGGGFGKQGKQRSTFFLTSVAKEWKKTVGETVVRASWPGKIYDCPCCALFHLFVFSNYDTDNRLKLMNDTLEGAYIVNDKKISRSAQFKTIVRKRPDIGFVYCLAPRESFPLLLSSFSRFADTLEGEDGILRSSYSSNVRGAITDFFMSELGMAERLSCTPLKGGVPVLPLKGGVSSGAQEKITGRKVGLKQISTPLAVGQ